MTHRTRTKSVSIGLEVTLNHCSSVDCKEPLFPLQREAAAFQNKLVGSDKHSVMALREMKGSTEHPQVKLLLLGRKKAKQWLDIKHGGTDKIQPAGFWLDAADIFVLRPQYVCPAALLSKPFHLALSSENNVRPRPDWTQGACM